MTKELCHHKPKTISSMIHTVSIIITASGSVDCSQIYSVFWENFAVFLLIIPNKMVNDDRVLCII